MYILIYAWGSGEDKTMNTTTAHLSFFTQLNIISSRLNRPMSRWATEGCVELTYMTDLLEHHLERDANNKTMFKLHMFCPHFTDHETSVHCQSTCKWCSCDCYLYGYFYLPLNLALPVLFLLLASCWFPHKRKSPNSNSTKTKRYEYHKLALFLQGSGLYWLRWL